jgi:hypothetical protein
MYSIIDAFDAIKLIYMNISENSERLGMFFLLIRIYYREREGGGRERERDIWKAFFQIKDFKFMNKENTKNMNYFLQLFIALYHNFFALVLQIMSLRVPDLPDSRNLQVFGQNFSYFLSFLTIYLILFFSI